MLFMAMTINFLDRQVLSIVSPILTKVLNISAQDYSYILFFFMFGMTMGQVPVGMLIDRYGARRGFSWLVIGWSIVGMFHSLGRTVAQFCGLRFLMGLHECGSFSAGVKVIGEWFPARERALASGLFNSGTLVGSIVAPPLIVLIASHFGWRAAFLIPGAVGCLWVIPWLRLYWEPSRHPRLTASDRQEIALLTTHANPEGIQPRVRTLLGLAPVWGVILLRAFGGPVNQFYWYWLPLYLTHERGMSLAMIGLVGGLPFFSGGVGNIGGGWLSSHLVRKGWELGARPQRRDHSGYGPLFARDARAPGRQPGERPRLDLRGGFRHQCHVRKPYGRRQRRFSGNHPGSRQRSDGSR